MAGMLGFIILAVDNARADFKNFLIVIVCVPGHLVFRAPEP